MFLSLTLFSPLSQRLPILSIWFWAAFWLRDILFQIRGSVPLANGSRSGSGSDLSLFVSELQDGSKKYFSSPFAYYFLKVHLHHSSKMKSHKTVEIKVFLTIFA
jgi:hypothetical protein